MSITALSPLDGRYRSKVAALDDYFSEFGLIHHRLKVELAWLLALCAAHDIQEAPALPTADLVRVQTLIEYFSPGQALEIKNIEAETNHDVKALEYWIKRHFADSPAITAVGEFIHFACTSEDINNTAHALMLQGGRDKVLLPALDRVMDRFKALAHEHAHQPMLSRTHGQTASPTTLGKEMANIAARLNYARSQIIEVKLTAKFNGAVGNYNAHMSAYPNVDWPVFAQKFVESLGLSFNPYTIQIEPHDRMASLFDAMARCNTILIDACRDIWMYVSLGYFKQKLKEGEVGSSTMPHKVNPIDFENAEGNFGLANALLKHLSEKLPMSRMQRDLTDSTVLRNMGVAFGHMLLGLDSCLKGLNKLEVDTERLHADLAQAWEVLAEPVQTVMRRYGIPKPYEQLKALTRGKGITQAALQDFISKLDIPAAERERLLQMTPANYIGQAAQLALKI